MLGNEKGNYRIRHILVQDPAAKQGAPVGFRLPYHLTVEDIVADITLCPSHNTGETLFIKTSSFMEGA